MLRTLVLYNLWPDLEPGPSLVEPVCSFSFFNGTTLLEEVHSRQSGAKGILEEGRGSGSS